MGKWHELDSGGVDAQICGNRASCHSYGFTPTSYQEAMPSCPDHGKITRPGTPVRPSGELIGTTTASYRHSGPAVLEVMELAYRIARIVEDKSGLTGHDFEVDQPTRTGDPVKAAARLGAVSDWAQHHLS